MHIPGLRTRTACIVLRFLLVVRLRPTASRAILRVSLPRDSSAIRFNAAARRAPVLTRSRMDVSPDGESVAKLRASRQRLLGRSGPRKRCAGSLPGIGEDAQESAQVPFESFGSAGEMGIPACSLPLDLVSDCASRVISARPLPASLRASGTASWAVSARALARTRGGGTPTPPPGRARPRYSARLRRRVPGEARRLSAWRTLSRHPRRPLRRPLSKDRGAPPP